MQESLSKNQETARLAAFTSYPKVLTADETIFDNIVQLASLTCEMPIGLISLIGETHIWVKAKHGIKATEMPRNNFFCEHTLLQEEVFIVEDAKNDVRFSAHPFVKGAPYIGFYAGAPLINPEGYHLGSLCVMDHVPRKLKNPQRAVLEKLAAQIVQILEDRKRISIEKDTINKRYELAQKAAQFGLWDWDLVTDQFIWDAQMFRIFGLPATHPLSAATAFARIHPDDINRVRKEIKETAQDKEEIVLEFRIVWPDTNVHNGKLYATVVSNADLKPVRIIGVFFDVTEEKVKEDRFKALNERYALAQRGANFGVWDWDIPTNTLIWDEKMFEIYDVLPTSFQSAFEGWEASLYPDDAQRAKKDVQDALAGTREFNSEFRIMWRDNSVHTIKGQAIVLKDQNNNPYRMIGINFDITEQKKVEHIK